MYNLILHYLSPESLGGFAGYAWICMHKVHYRSQRRQGPYVTSSVASNIYDR